jgi:hypothetical protein
MAILCFYIKRFHALGSGSVKTTRGKTFVAEVDTIRTKRIYKKIVKFIKGGSAKFSFVGFTRKEWTWYKRLC